jgi:hypothetical protein
MDDDGYLLVPLLCSYLHTARRSLAFRFSALRGQEYCICWFLRLFPSSISGLANTRRAGNKVVQRLDSFAFLFCFFFCFSLVQMGGFSTEYCT